MKNKTNKFIKIMIIFCIITVVNGSLLTFAAIDNELSKKVVKVLDGSVDFEVISSEDTSEGLLVNCAITNNTSKIFSFYKDGSYILDNTKQDYGVTNYEQEHSKVNIRSGARNYISIRFKDAKKNMGPFELHSIIGERQLGMYIDETKVTFMNIE